MHIITGIGRSGTSFICTIFKNLGHEMGVWVESVNAGYESKHIGLHNKKILSGDYGGTSTEKEALLRDSKNTFIAKDPRFMFTLGHWIQAGAAIDSIIFCTRSYTNIIESSEKSNAGMMALFNGMSDRGRKNICKAIRANFIKTAKQNNIPICTINYPESVQNYREVRCLFELGIVKDEPALQLAWHKAIHKKQRSKES